MENARGTSDILRIIIPSIRISGGVPFHKKKGTTVGYVHFLPETVENSIRLPGLARKLFYWYMIAFYKRMDHLVTVNPYFIDALQKYGVPREKDYLYTECSVGGEILSAADAAAKKGAQRIWTGGRKVHGLECWTAPET